MNVVSVESFIDANMVDKVFSIGGSVIVLFSKYYAQKNSMQTELDAIEE